MTRLEVDPQTKREIELETGSIEEGVRHFKRVIRSRSAAQTKPGLAFLRQNIKALVDATQDEQHAICGGKSKLHKHSILLLSLSPEKLAFITLQTILNMLTWEEPPSFRDIAFKIGERCFRQWKYETRRRKERQQSQQKLGKLTRLHTQLLLPKIYDQLLGRYGNPESVKALQRAIKLASKVEGDWTKDDRAILLGSSLLDIVEKHTEIMEVAELKSTDIDELEYRTRKEVWLTNKAQELISKLQERFGYLATPIYFPMIVPPAAWTNSTNGGYLCNRDKSLLDIHLVKHHENPAIRKTVEAADLKIPLAAINALQETTWQINRRIYEYVREACSKRIPLPELPERNRLPLPDLPDNNSEESLQDYRRKLHEVRRMNRQIAAELTGFHLRMRACKKLKEEKNLYFPYQLDWRGRVYPIPQALHPQADDLGRALLRFALGRPLGERGAFWLAVHLANMGGQDKLPFNKRLEWVEENDSLIRTFVDNPLNPQHPFWNKNKVDKPWCLLAASIEWLDHLNNPNFESHLPITVDGTCNGLQHLSAMGRDEEGGKWTNLLLSDHPQDIYQEVAGLVRSRVQVDADNNNKEAHYWLSTHDINRKVVKRPTMTTPYGVKPQGIRNQLIEMLIEEKKDQCRVERRQLSYDEICVAREHAKQHAKYLEPIVRDCIKQVVVKAIDIMNWLQRVAGILADAGRGIYWITPAGFPVVLENRRPKARRIITVSGKLTVYEPDPQAELNKTEQLKIAPQFVHSMDAAHLMQTVARLHSEELGHFQVIHDSYGVHACDVDKLNGVLREEFVKIYRKDVLTNFLREQTAHISDHKIHLDNPPPQGKLVIEEILKSDYLFA